MSCGVEYGADLIGPTCLAAFMEPYSSPWMGINSFGCNEKKLQKKVKICWSLDFNQPLIVYLQLLLN